MEGQRSHLSLRQITLVAVTVEDGGEEAALGHVYVHRCVRVCVYVCVSVAVCVHLRVCPQRGTGKPMTMAGWHSTFPFLAFKLQCGGARVSVCVCVCTHMCTCKGKHLGKSYTQKGN